MTTHVSGAARTISILRSLCEQVRLPAAEFILRLANGFRVYGDSNHLSEQFDLRAEWDAEILDVVAFAAVAVSRGVVSRDDPALMVYMQAARRMVAAQKAMLEDDAAPVADPSWDTYTPDGCKCAPCAGQCVTE